MSGDEKKSKTSSAAKKEAPAKDKETPKDKAASGADAPKAEGGETAAAAPSANYSRGEGQKPVTQAYKDNWNAIFAKKKKKR